MELNRSSCHVSAPKISRYTVCTYLEYAQRFHLLHKMGITCHYAPLLAITMDLHEVRRTSISTEYRDVTFYSCLNLLCTYLEHVQYYYLLHRIDITHYYGLLLAVTMDLPGACKASTGYIDVTCYHLLSCLYYALTWSMCSIATYYIEWTSHVTRHHF